MNSKLMLCSLAPVMGCGSTFVQPSEDTPA